MLPRVLEPEAMDTPEEARDYDAMDHGEVNARFVADFLGPTGRAAEARSSTSAPDPAQIPIALCRADPMARVLGIDLAEHDARHGASERRGGRTGRPHPARRGRRQAA